MSSILGHGLRPLEHKGRLATVAVVLFRPFWNHPFAPIAGGLPLHRFTTAWGDLFSLLFNPWTIWRMLVEGAIFGPPFAATVVQRGPLEIALVPIGASVRIALAAFGAR